MHIFIGKVNCWGIVVANTFKLTIKLYFRLQRWLDKLAIAALTNHTRVFRQAIVGSSYALLDDNLFPRPVSTLLSFCSVC